jgi:hypothetical protein
MGHKLPLFIAVIIGLGFLLAFRSLLVPAIAAVMNLLAAGAASACWSRSSSTAGASGRSTPASPATQHLTHVP